MLKKIDFKYLILSMLFLSLGTLTILGSIQTTTNFQDIDNEIAFTLVCFVGGVVISLGIKK